MVSFWKRAKLRAKNYSSDQEGATAVEFALVAIPFFALVFAIVELAIIFFISSALSHAVGETGRLIRVGQFQNCGGGPAFKNLVCANMNGLGNCAQNLTIDVISSPEFNLITIPDQRDIDTDVDGNTSAPTGIFESPAASTPVVVQATFYYKLALPAQLTRLETIPRSGFRILKSTTAFRTEPFPTSSACPTPPSTPANSVPLDTSSGGIVSGGNNSPGVSP